MIRIITVGYHNPEGLVALLDSLREHWQVPAEFVLYDNGGAREPAEKWAAAHASASFKIKVLGEGKNLGFSAAVNRGAEYESGSECTHLLLLNPDARLASNVTSAKTSKLECIPGIVGLRVFDDVEKQRRQANARRFPSWKTSLTGREGLITKWFPRNPWSRAYLAQDLDPNVDSQVDWVSGCALWVSTSDWKKLGGLDESYFLYVEDVDLGRKAQRLKIPVSYSPCVDVVHETRGSARKAPWKSDFYHHMGMWTYHVKWSGPFGIVAGPFVFVGIWMRFLLRRILSR